MEFIDFCDVKLRSFLRLGKRGGYGGTWSFNYSLKSSNLLSFKNIMFNFFSFQQIKLYEFDPNKIEFILKKTKIYSRDIFSKYFYYMKQSEKFVIFQYNEVILYDNLLSTETTIYKLDEEEEQMALKLEKEANKLNELEKEKYKLI